MREHKVLVGVAGDNVLRFAPPLIVSASEISRAMDALDLVLAQHMAEAGA
jgi:acetylornithine/succinyldiaminopimelate/putrescine aminotransferase